MTGNEILNEEFERAGMRGGYRAEQVDAYLKNVAKYVDEINEKNEDLSYKLKILADKIEEYKRDESSIRDALLGAQKLGASVLEEANQKAEVLTRDSKAAADEMLSQAKNKIESLTKDSLQKANFEITSLKRECEREQRHLDSMKQEVSMFRSSILKQYKNHLDLLSNLPTVDTSVQSSEPIIQPSEVAPQVDTIKDEQKNEIKQNTQSLKAVGIREAEQASTDKNGTFAFAKIVDSKSSDEDKTNFFNLSNTASMPETQTIKSDILPLEDEIQQEVKLQTKEFNSSSRKPSISATEINERGNVSPAIPFNPPKKSSMAGKFAELDFGKNNE